MWLKIEIILYLMILKNKDDPLEKYHYFSKIIFVRTLTCMWNFRSIIQKWVFPFKILKESTFEEYLEYCVFN